MNNNKGRLKSWFRDNFMILLGLTFMLIAVVLAFAAIHQEVETYNGPERVLEGDGWNRLESRIQMVNSTVYMEYNGRNGSTQASVNISDRSVEDNRTIFLEADEPRTVEIKSDAYWIYPNFDSEDGNVTYKQTIIYNTQPYGVLSLPAFFLTIIGIVVTYKGKYARRLEKQLEEQGEEEYKKGEKKKRFMGVDWGKKKK